MRLWIVGNFLMAQAGGVVWEFMGVVATEGEAIAACTKLNYFYAPATLGEILPDKTEVWPDCKYPFQLGS